MIKSHQDFNLNLLKGSKNYIVYQEHETVGIFMEIFMTPTICLYQNKQTLFILIFIYHDSLNYFVAGYEIG